MYAFSWDKCQKENERRGRKNVKSAEKEILVQVTKPIVK